MPTVHEQARSRDEADPLAPFADRFAIPDEVYLEGNSLGPLSDRAEQTLERAVDQWRTLGIRGWTEAEPPWFHYGEQLGDKLAPLVGASPESVVATNSTTVNIHTLIGTVLDHYEADIPQGVLVNDLDFPTDHYAIRAQLRQRGLDPTEYLHLVESRDGRTIEMDDIVSAIRTEDIGIVFMPSVLYRSGQLFDLERITEVAHDEGAIVGFDLAHSIGVVPHDLDAIGVDFAVWCGYKYLNAGPGSIGGLYVNERHFEADPALAGWWGHEKATQFELNLTHTPAPDAGAWQIGTVPVLAAAPMFGALELIHEAGIDALREKSIGLTDFLIDLVDDRLEALGCTVGTPRSPERRGGHVSVEHPEAEAISIALRERGVVVDYRPPNVIRMSPAPLFTRYVDIVAACETLEAIIESGDHETVDSEGSVT